MVGNKSSALNKAKAAKKNEFYTCYTDIEQEMNSYILYNKDVFRGKTILLPCDDPAWSEFTRYFVFNFEQLGLKKLISTSYADDNKGAIYKPQISWFEDEFPQYDENKTNSHGKIFTLDEEDLKKGKKINIDDLQWDYLEGDGDFRTAEVTALRDEADFIITNPPFSLFREFLAWILEGNKKFIVIGSQNAITYKEIFPYLKNNEIWLGNGFKDNVGYFISPYEDVAVSSNHKEGKIRISGVMWFTNVDHGKRHEILKLDTMDNNLRFDKSLRNDFQKRFGKIEYPHYDNFDGIDVPAVSNIPSDYAGAMGVPITFLEKYNPVQFELLGIGTGNLAKILKIKKNYRGRTDLAYTCKNGVQKCPFQRLIIKYTDKWINYHKELFKNTEDKL